MSKFNRKDVITSIKNPIIQEVLNIQKNQKNNDLFVGEGINIYYESLKHKSLVYSLELYNENNNYISNTSIIISDNVLKKISSYKNPFNLIGVYKKNQIIKQHNKILFLDNVQDPGNIGTLIRTATAFQFDAVYNKNNFFTPKIINSTQGSIFNIYLGKIDDTVAEISKLKENGYKIICATINSGSKELNKIEFKFEKIVLVLGNEGHGINKEIEDLADLKIYIPISFESLNVAIAGSIIMYEINQNNYKKD
ncbi:TrmH family RNA methyltransferase [Mycoplasmopsis lipofaciens]|uniref:TrmH family RNA methyltransferase n=1 Tax=Mycoplasmopsis lipofaciens TaxID=114884 RepID=UPI00056AD69B|nr:RNA methyltransferase [Mycoplasmopsis lipofaciens]